MGSTLVLDRRWSPTILVRHGTRTAWFALLAFVLALTPAAALTSAPSSPPALAEVQPVSIYGLPLPAQAVISKTLGMGDSAYHVRELRAANPAQKLAAMFASTGVTVTADGHRIGLTLAGPAVEPIASGNRVEYRRGPVTEWYVNGPLGLEQGFTLARPLGSPLRIQLSGTLTPRVEGRTVLFGDVFRLRGLLAYDADLRPVPARFAVEGRALLIRVDDRTARYPISVDPFVERARFQSSPSQAGAAFGEAVAIEGDTIVVGALGESAAAGSAVGAAYVFVRPPEGWASPQTQSARLSASDGAELDQLGTSVAVEGETVIAGALWHDTAGMSNRGAAYVFTRPPGGWAGDLTETARLIASDGAASDQFGIELAFEAGAAVIAANGDDLGRGSAYVFVRPPGGWTGLATESAKLIVSAADRAVGDELSRVAIDGDTVVASAPGDNGFRGAAYVFERPAGGWSGTVNEVAKLTASDAVANEQDGQSIAIDSGTVAVGASIDTVAGIARRGALYVYERPLAGWSGPQTEAAKLIVSDGSEDDRLGFSVAVEGGTIVGGAYQEYDGDGSVDFGRGAAYVYVRPDAGWSGTQTETTKLRRAGGERNDFFGQALALRGDALVVGAPGVGTSTADGAAFVFDPGCRLVGTTLQIKPPLTSPVTVVRSGDAIDVIGAGVCEGSPAVTTVDEIEVIGTGATDALTVDLSGGTFAPGASAEGAGMSEIEWSTSSVESLTIQGSSGVDTIRFGSAGVNLNGDNDADMTVPDVATATVLGGLGNDNLSGGGAHGADLGKWAKPLLLYGEDGMDKLTGGTDDDTLDGGNGKDTIQQFKTADGGDTIVGGAGVDQLSYATRQAGDPLSVTLDGTANDGSTAEGDNVGVDVENVLLGAGNDFFDATAVLVNNVVQGGAGTDELHGGGKADQLRGDGGNDLLFGEGGNDILNAIEPETGTSDTLSGGTGTDTCRTDDADVINDC